MSSNIVDDRLIQKQYKSYDLINAHSLAVWGIIILQNITVQLLEVKKARSTAEYFLEHTNELHQCIIIIILASRSTISMTQ